MTVSGDLPDGYKPEDFSIDIEIAAERNIMERAISLYVLGRQRFGKKRLSVMSIPTFTTYEDEGQALGSLRDPSLKVSYEAAQRLMDELWRCGIRPTEEGTAGQVAAMQAHLQDMRRIVFDFIGKTQIKSTLKPDDALMELERFNSTLTALCLQRKDNP